MATYKSIAYDQALSTGGSQVLLSETTASSDSTISFTSGIDSTYKEYIFKFINCHPSANGPNFNVNFSIDGGSNYNVTKTTWFFHSRHDEDGSDGQVVYDTGGDLAQGTGNQYISRGIGNSSADECLSGEFVIYNPSDTTFIKHFVGVSNSMEVNASSQAAYFGGYCTTTSAVNAVRFAFNTGNIDTGTIKLYGVL